MGHCQQTIGVFSFFLHCCHIKYISKYTRHNIDKICNSDVFLPFLGRLSREQIADLVGDG